MGLEMGMNWWEWDGMGMLQAIPTHLDFVDVMYYCSDCCVRTECVVSTALKLCKPYALSQCSVYHEESHKTDRSTIDDELNVHQRQPTGRRVPYCQIDRYTGSIQSANAVSYRSICSILCCFNWRLCSICNIEAITKRMAWPE